MIAILDYGAGNLRSVENALDAIGAKYTIARDAEGLRSADKIILPGVGHFGQMMRALDAMGVREPLREAILGGTPFLGICLGLHALFQGSEEAPGVSGLGIFEGRARRFPRELRVPHMGWNVLVTNRASRLFAGAGREPYVYFAHSYYVPLSEESAATCTYSLPYSAAVERDNIFAVQFHPEKSGPLGLTILRNFVELR